jgi:ABC-type branched-subunit amino acid transport system substrate-binding protein
MIMTTTRRARRLGLPAGLLALALLASACGDDDEPSGADGTPSASGALGPANAATGEPITIGYVSTGKTANLDSTVEIEAAKATAKYVNDYLGGLNGRRIELKVCETTIDPVKAADCGNQMVQSKVAAVLAGVPNGVDPMVKVLSPAKIPFVIHQAVTQSALGTPGTFVMSNALVAFGGPAAYARQKGFKQATLIVLDVPAAIGPARQLGALLFANAKVPVEVVGVPPGTADMAPQIQAAEGKNPDLYHIIGDPNFCASAIKAIKTLGVDAAVTMIPSCVSATNPASIPGGFEGIKSFSGAILEGAENDLFRAILDKYDVDASPDARTAGGFQAVLGFARAMQAAKTTDLTAAGILTAMQTMPPTPYPLTDGATFQCNGKAIALAPGICSTFGAIGNADRQGLLSGYEKLDSEGIYAVPAR